jgi:hypothetical protein
MVSTPLQRHFVIYGTVACHRPASAIDAVGVEELPMSRPKRPVVATAAPADRREGLWTLLQLLRVWTLDSAAPCAGRPELANPPVEPAQRLRRRA